MLPDTSLVYPQSFTAVIALGLINFIDETNDYTSTFNLKLSDLYESKEDSKPEILNMKFNIYLKIIVIFSLM